MRLESCLKTSWIFKTDIVFMEAKWFCCHCDFSGVKSPTSKYQRRVAKYQRRVAQKPDLQCPEGGIEISQEKIPFTHNVTDLPLRLQIFARDRQPRLSVLLVLVAQKWPSLSPPFIRSNSETPKILSSNFGEENCNCTGTL